MMTGRGDEVSVDGDSGRNREGDGGGGGGSGADESGCDVSYNRGSRHVGGSCGGCGGSVAVLEVGVLTGGGTNNSDHSYNYHVSISSC